MDKGNASHGFCSREEWNYFFNQYNSTIMDLNNSYSQLLAEELPRNEWIATLQQNSAQMRSVYEPVAKLFDRHIRYFLDDPSHWTVETAVPLIDYLFRYATRMENAGALYDITTSMLPLFEAGRDQVSLMKCHTVRAISLSFLNQNSMAADIWSDRITARKYYESNLEALSPEERSMGLSIYDFAFDVLCNQLRQKTLRLTDIVEEMLSFYESGNSTCLRVVLEDQGYEFNRLLPSFSYRLTFSALFLSPGECKPEQEEMIRQIAEAAYLENQENKKLPAGLKARNALIYLMSERMCGNRTDEDVLNYIRKILKVFQLKVAENTDLLLFSTYDIIEDIVMAAATLIKDQKEHSGLFQEIIQLCLNYCSKLPASAYWNYVTSSFIYSCACTTLKYLPQNELLSALLRLTAFRQNQTAIHSIMVGRLSAAVLSALIQSKPEELCGQLSTGSAGEVAVKEPEFIRFIAIGSLLHDIGKILCTSATNTQFRRINDIEFRAIKYHSEAGANILNHIPQLSEYSDIAAGHHKSFDGAFGYPSDFNNIQSPIKIFIDIITICDSLDAATDYLGRTYANPKDFGTVLVEFQTARGTRYSDLITDLISRDPVLQSKLIRILDKDRKDISYEIHELNAGRIAWEEIAIHFIP